MYTSQLKHLTYNAHTTQNEVFQTHNVATGIGYCNRVLSAMKITSLYSQLICCIYAIFLNNHILEQPRIEVCVLL